MEPISPLALNEEAINAASARKPSLLRSLITLILIAAGAFALYIYRDALTSLVRKPVSANATDSAAATPRTPGPGGRGAAGGRGGRGAGNTMVVALAARKADMPVYLHGLGSVTPSSIVTVRSRVDGQLINVVFKEGQVVRQGELLAEIDRRPFEVQLAQAEAQLAQAKGNLDRDLALLKGASTEFVRNEELLQKGLIPKQQADIQSATVDQYEGSISADHAAMETAQAAITNANLQITYSKISAPISGRIGLRLVDSGNIVRASDPNGLAVIAQVEPITVLFNIPEDNLGAVLKKLRGGATLKAEAWDRDDQTLLTTGTLLTVDNQIDTSTGTSKLKALFDNQNGALFPNQFVNVHLLIDVNRNATIIPAAAIQRGPQGTYIYVVGADRKAQIRNVKILNTEASDVAIGAELQPGEMVIVEGMDKVQEGARVDVQVEGEKAKS